MKLSVLMLAVATAAIFPNPVSAETRIRIGHFPNITDVKVGFIRTAPDLSKLFENP